jgi:hypothetical protein
MTDPQSNVCSYAYELPNPYHPEADDLAIFVRDEPLRVGDRMTRSFPDFTGVGPEREWEVVAIEPTGRDGEAAAVRGFVGWPGDKSPILQGRLILRPLD